jgi:hypothetical protein
MRRVVLGIAGAFLLLGAVFLPLHAAEPAKDNAAPLHVTYYYLPG